MYNHQYNKSEYKNIYLYIRLLLYKEYHHKLYNHLSLTTSPNCAPSVLPVEAQRTGYSGSGP